MINVWHRLIRHNFYCRSINYHCLSHKQHSHLVYGEFNGTTYKQIYNPGDALLLVPYVENSIGSFRVKHIENTFIYLTWAREKDAMTMSMCWGRKGDERKADKWTMLIDFVSHQQFLFHVLPTKILCMRIISLRLRHFIAKLLWWDYKFDYWLISLLH